MKYAISANQVKNSSDNVRGFASIVFGDAFKITNIAILENTEKGQYFVSMPRYKSNERDENNAVVYKDVCNPITKEFREELYGQILDAYDQAKEHGAGQKNEEMVEMPSYKTKQNDEKGKPVYQVVCYPVTKEFREKLYTEIIAAYEREKERQKEQSQSRAEEKAKDGFVKAPEKETPFR